MPLLKILPNNNESSSQSIYTDRDFKEMMRWFKCCNEHVEITPDLVLFASKEQASLAGQLYFFGAYSIHGFKTLRNFTHVKERLGMRLQPYCSVRALGVSVSDMTQEVEVVSVMCFSQCKG